MKRVILGVTVLTALAACDPAVPDSAAGVGFDSYDRYQERQRRETQLNGGVYVPPPSTVATSSLDGDSADATASAQAAAANSGEAPLDASPSNPAPQTVVNASGISDENNFDAVSNERSIEGDAAHIAQNRAIYQVIQPTALPSRTGGGEPNVVEYALNSSNPLGSRIYKRNGFNLAAKNLRNCAKYSSSDLAQEDFLAKGGPAKDRLALDPDGDGYACGWDPSPFRVVKQN